MSARALRAEAANTPKFNRRNVAKHASMECMLPGLGHIDGSRLTINHSANLIGTYPRQTSLLHTRIEAGGGQ